MRIREGRMWYGTLINVVDGGLINIKKRIVFESLVIKRNCNKIEKI